MATPSTTAVHNRQKLDELLAANPNVELFVEVAIDPRYEVSNIGRVRNKQSGKILRVHKHSGGYWRIGLDCKLKYVHVLVARAFVPSDFDSQRVIVDHIDGNKDNFRWDNLRWLTASENTQAHYDLSQKALGLIMLTRDGIEVGRFPSVTKCQKAFPTLRLTAHGISMTCSGITKSHRQHVFRYVDGGRKRQTPRALFADEVFKNIGTYEGHDFSCYEISNYGVLRNKRGMYLVQVQDGRYTRYQLYGNSRVKVEVRAHRLVAHAFCEGRTHAKKIVNHKDGNPGNNHSSNLEWCTSQENTLHSVGKGVEQLTLDGQVVATYASMTAAAVAVGCDSGDISRCCSGKRRTAGGYKWRLAD